MPHPLGRRWQRKNESFSKKIHHNIWRGLLEIFMARPLRLIFENAHYHVMARGMRQEKIFYENRDREVFLNKADENFKKYRVVCYAYCLMENHYHFFIKTVLPNLPQVMHYLNSSYTNWFKAKYKIIGPLFQGRYKSTLVDEDHYALVLSAYIHLNPIRNGISTALEDYKWSSFNSYIGKTKSFDWLDTDFILSYFNKKKEKYKQFVYKQIGKDLSKDVYKGCILGGEDFVTWVKNIVQHEDIDNREIPQSKFLKKKIDARTIIKVVSDSLGVKLESLSTRGKNNIPRKIAVYLISKYTVLNLSNIGELFNMDYSAVSQLIRRFKLEINKNSEIKQATKMIIEKIEMSNVET